MRVALVAGESSGDLLGAGLIRALQSRCPEATFEGVAGPEMAAAGCTVLEPAETLAVMGLIEPLKEIPRLLALRKALLKRWTRTPPDVFVGIDAPDFNLGLEQRLKASGIRTIHYVSPSVWAWRQGRTRKIRAATDRVLCLLPFEQSFLENHGIKADFVGHPLADATPERVDVAADREALGIGQGDVLAVLPGSRHGEVSRLGPVFAATARLLAEQHPTLNFVAPMATDSIRESFAGHLESAGVLARFQLTDGNAEQVMAAADIVLLASGTASLQAALLGKPMVAAYRVAGLTFAIVKRLNLVKVQYVTLPNLLTDTPLVPEFIQDDARPEALAGAVSDLLADPGRRAEITTQFRVLRTTLARGANERAADAVMAEVAADAGRPDDES
jgi:lipid-A-disaccharide synthase